MVGRRSRRVGLVRGVDVGADGLEEDVEPIQLVYRAANCRESFLQGVVLVAVVGEDGVEDALEEAGAGGGRADHADGRDGHRLGRVQANDLGLATLRLFHLAVGAFIELPFALLEVCRVDWSLELLEDLLVLLACEIAGGLFELP